MQELPGHDEHVQQSLEPFELGISSTDLEPSDTLEEASLSLEPAKRFEQDIDAPVEEKSGKDHPSLDLDCSQDAGVGSHESIDLDSSRLHCVLCSLGRNKIPEMVVGCCGSAVSASCSEGFCGSLHGGRQR